MKLLFVFYQVYHLTNQAQYLATISVVYYFLFTDNYRTEIRMGVCEYI